MTPGLVITGATAIGREIGCSASTVRRHYRRGWLRDVIYRAGPETSPLRMLRVHVARARSAMMAAVHGQRGIA